ncbi:hypothetical protein QK290_15600 [Pseudarthrobacter sp. AL07]|uniref:hypothetical protein n=1 Tax=unclassified Pseudarthrobacter TaxID=2647000 RepID=UPI00249AE44A|nr:MULTISPECIES: hypothetical protein [unclassified Pseudarthrobacter]MDI3195756.1 hypothetical protein [Pseudarthrobacter sp. AL20]MDI3209892.1 hypothetical protein [Pseudarthrobacter sp. AL07]
METFTETLRMTLSDVASLAQVQRPVVSMWRKRSSGGPLPFPTAASHVNGVEMFDADHITAWLQATGRGNNPEARNDVAVFARLAAPPAEAPRDSRQTFDGLTSLLALKVITGQAVGGSTATDLLDAADEADPDDVFLYAELEGLGSALPGLAGFADRLADSAFSAPAAFEKLLAHRFKEGLREQSDTALTDDALRLVGATAMELASTLDGRLLFVDSTPGGSDVMQSIVEQFGESRPITFLTADHHGSASRLARRRLAVHGTDSSPVKIDAKGAFAVSGPAVHVAQYPAPGDPSLNTGGILLGIENIVLQMDDSQRAVVIAPARVLCDALAGDAGNLRSDLLRSGRVRAIVRLQSGLLRAKPREPQALWVLGPSFAEVPIADRWTMVADLSTTPLTTAVSQDLISDVVASMGSRATIRAHSFRFARLVQTRVLLAGKGALVSVPAIKSTTAARGAEAALRVEELVRLLSAEAAHPPALPNVQPAATAAGIPSATVQELITAGTIKYLKGIRLEETDMNREAGSRILGREELMDPHNHLPRFITLLDFAAKYPGGRLTEPGDVVFCTSPRPAAVVDAEGGAVVVFPARILRIHPGDPGGLVPDVVAADINARPAADKTWRNWRLRRTPDRQRRPLAAVLAQVQHEQDAARERLRQLEELATLITDGVAGGSLTLTDPISHAAPTEGTA